MDPTAIDDHHDLFRGFAEDRHDLMEILAQRLRSKMWDDFIDDAGGAVLHGANDRQQHATGETAPRAMLQPHLAFEAFFAFDLALAQRARGEANALRFVPPARAGQGKTPEERFIFIE
jgi:hypothetical protein